jgi:hypothetical protein
MTMYSDWVRMMLEEFTGVRIKRLVNRQDAQDDVVVRQSEPSEPMFRIRKEISKCSSKHN